MGHGVRDGRVGLLAVPGEAWVRLRGWSGTWGCRDGRVEVAEWLRLSGG